MIFVVLILALALTLFAIIAPFAIWVIGLVIFFGTIAWVAWYALFKGGVVLLHPWPWI